MAGRLNTSARTAMSLENATGITVSVRASYIRILQLLSNELSVQETASQLGIKATTVQTDLAEALVVLGVNTLTAAIALLRQQGAIT